MASDDTFDEVSKHIKALHDASQPLDYDYLRGKLLHGADLPGLPPAALSFIPGEPSLDPVKQRLVVPFSTSFGSCVLQIYRGPFTPDPPEEGAEWRVYFGINLGKELVLAKLPVGGAIEDGAFAIRGVHILATSHDLTKDECSELYFSLTGKRPGHELGATDYGMLPTPPPTGINTRIVVKTDLQIATANYPLIISAGTSSAKPPAAGSGEGGASAADPSSTATVHGRIGPIVIERVFGTYDIAEKKFGLGLDASVDFGVVKLSLQDLTATFDASGVSGPFDFDVKGVDLGGGIPDVAQFGGGLYLADRDPLALWGAASLSIVDQFDVSLMAGYATVPQAPPSLFGFGFVRVPIGGPEFFEVNGVALGFGYDRDLIIPPVETLSKFPFIQAAMGFAYPHSTSFKNPFPTDPTDPGSLVNTLAVLGDAVPVKSGAYWGAIGVAFSSFKVLTGFALLALEAGQSTRLSAIGEVQLTMPPKIDEAKPGKPLVFIDTFLRIVIDFSSGEVALDAYINSNSFIVEQDIHITGGIAIRGWFGGKHPGEFVVTAGGYSPHIDFSAYSYYPVVPRLAMSMAISDAVQVKGRLYFAVTSAMAMYGMAFQISGQWGPASLWAILSFDALIAWEPLHYDVDISVEVGASLQIKVWFVHVTITVHVGAMLHIWGPPFSGQARLDLSVCTISWHLGQNADPASPPMSWVAFKDRYLTNAVTPTGEPPDAQTKAVADIRVTSTPLTTLPRQTEDDARWLVDPESVMIATSSRIPSKSWSASILKKDYAQQTATNTAFGVGPCAIEDGKFSTTHRVTVTGPVEVAFSILEITQSIPAAIWHTGDAAAAGPGSTIANVLAGLEMRPVHPPPDHTFAIDADMLLTQSEGLTLPLIRANTDHGGDFGDATVCGTIATARAVANRTQVLKALSSRLTVPDPDVRGFAAGHDADLFLNPPRKKLLGEDRPDGR